MYKTTTLSCVFLAMCLMAINSTKGQSVDSLANNLTGFPSKLFSRLQKKTAGLDNALTRQTQAYLRKMARQEERLKKKLYRLDSASASRLFTGSAGRYAQLAEKLKNDSGRNNIPLRGSYMPYVDSMKTSMEFLHSNPQLLGTPASIQQLQSSFSEFRQLQARIQDADQIKQFIGQRKAQLQQYLQQYTHLPSDISSAFNGYKAQAYYYTQQVQACKDMLNDPDKLLKAALQALNRVPAFASFVKQNSMLSSLLGAPSNMSPGATPQGLATRDQLLAAIQGPSGANGPNITGVLQQNVQAGQSQLDQFRDKLNGAGGSGGDLEMPGFRPNNQKTKTFFKRLEFGTNLQSAHSTSFYPTTTDLGFSLGYKLSDKSTIGIGASYKIGWGNDIRHIQFSSQGIGLRSFMDMQVKKSWYITGGFEYNYQQPFTIQGLPVNLENWQKSGLIGLSKIVSMKTKMFKNTKLQLLWDFLSYEQRPVSQPLKFRVGYSF